jgi:hypothetical protein
MGVMGVYGCYGCVSFTMCILHSLPKLITPDVILFVIRGFSWSCLLYASHTRHRMLDPEAEAEAEPELDPEPDPEEPEVELGPEAEPEVGGVGGVGAELDRGWAYAYRIERTEQSALRNLKLSILVLGVLGVRLVLGVRC